MTQRCQILVSQRLEQAPLLVRHTFGVADAPVGVTDEVAVTVDHQADELGLQRPVRRLTICLRHGDDDISQQAGVQASALPLLHGKREHVGGAVDAAVLGVEFADLVVVGEEQRELGLN